MALFLVALPILLFAFSGATDAGDAGVPGEESCSGCHNGPGGEGGVTLTFPGGPIYSPGVRQHLVVTVTDTGQRRWGFQLTARLAASPMTQAGSFTPSSDGYTQLVCTQSSFRSQVFGNSCATNGLPLQYIEHTQTGTRTNAKSPVAFEFDWTPPATASGNLTFYVAAVAANGDNSERGDHCFTARYTVTLPGAPPAINSVVNGASFQPDVSAGSWLTILGSNLAPRTRSWTADDFAGSALPTQLDGVAVKLNGKSAYLSYISPGQINAQAPADGSLGPVSVEVTNNGVIGPAGTARLQPASPAFFLWNGKYAVATHADFTLAAPAGLFAGLTTVPAKPGETIILWGIGFGATTPAVAPGTIAPSSPVSAVASPVAVTVGSLPATVIGAALAPLNAGLYQIAVQIPAALADGDQPVIARVAGLDSPTNVLLGIKR